MKNLVCVKNKNDNLRFERKWISSVIVYIYYLKKINFTFKKINQQFH